MFAGTDLILSCPHCEALAQLPFPEMVELPGMITWTDGWQTAPGLDRPPRIAACPACQKTFWVGEAQQLGFLIPGKTPPEGKEEWAKAPVLKNLDAAGVQQAIDEGLAAVPDLELELRVLLWWRGNDEFRCADAPVGLSTSPLAIANMERFIEMTKDGSEDLLLFRAEAQRQLGRVADMEETLNGVGCSDYWPAKTRLIELAKSGSRKLDVLFLPLSTEELLAQHADSGDRVTG